MTLDDQALMGSKIVAGQVLMRAAARSSGLVDNFSNWLLGGLAATLALLVANVSDIKDYLPVWSIKMSAVWFVLSFAAALIAKLIAVFVASASAGASDGQDSGNSIAAENLDLDTFVSELTKPMFWPARAFTGSMLAKVKSGDFAAGGRLASRASQLQGLLVLLQAIFSVTAVAVLAAGLGA